MTIRQMKRGFSLMELIIAMLLLSLALLSYLWLNSFSRRSAMDTSFDLIALQLAREPIEVLRCMGYQWIKEKKDEAEFQKLFDRFQKTKMDEYPVETGYFSRTTTIKPFPSDDPLYYLVEVSVKRDGGAWWARPDFCLQGLIWKCPK